MTEKPKSGVTINDSRYLKFEIMVTKTVCYSLFAIATLLLISAHAFAKPISDEGTEDIAYYTGDATLADGPPKRLRMNRHGKREYFTYIPNDFADDLADSPPKRLRINRHGK